MNQPDFDEFLVGAANDQQHRVCEDLLSNPETIVSFQSTLVDDSLIVALRMDGDSFQDSQDLELLVEQVEKLVPRHSISVDELNRFLDPPEFPDELGKIGRFRIIEFLASGGMGLVFRAVDPDLDREVCVKLLSPSLEFNAEAKSRFERESREASRMGSERIVTVLEVGRQRGLPFFVMPMLEGMSLRAMLDKQVQVPPKQAIQITRQIAEGLQYAHDRQLLHRDIKPDNLWLTTTGDVVILDFGLARSTNDSTENEAPITRQGTVIGTPSYMSPEQVTGKELDQRSDLFSVGVVLIEMLTGESPFKKSNLFSTMMSVAGDEIQMDQIELMEEVPIGLRDLAQRLLHKNPDDRIESASELIRLLDQVEASPCLSLAGTSPPRKLSGSWTKYIAAGLVGILLSAIALAVWIANDKGTLVVSTSDPDVVVKIAGQEVSIHDPVADRTFQVRIGETPLPSGVYQLETESENGELVFSSQTIAIRRGEKTIVTVELVPGDSTADSIAADSNSSIALMEDLPWADKTRAAEAYVAETRKSLIDRVRKLPSISLADAGFDTSPALFDRATVQKPAKLGGIETWTVERLAGLTLSLSPNCDRTLLVGIQDDTSIADGFVRIFDQSRDLKTALPIPGRIRQVRWCEHASNLIAVSSWVRDVDVTASNRYAITVWQITSTGARLVRSIRASNRSFNWDAGYRIICFVDDKLSALRLDTGLIWSMPEAAGRERLLDGAISPDGRFVATYSTPSNNGQISIWDLKSGKFQMAIPSGILFHWGSDSQNIAVDVNRYFERDRASENSLEIWSMGSRQLTKSFQKQNQKKTCISPDLGTFAIKLKSGDVVLTDTSTRRERSVEPPNGFIEKTGGKFYIRWKSDNQLKFYNDKFETVWSRDKLGFSGQFSSVVEKAKIDQLQPSQFKLTDFRVTTTGELAIVGSRNWDAFPPEAGNKSSFAVTIDLAKNSVNRNATFSKIGWPQKNPVNFVAFNRQPTAVPTMLSPNGKFVLTWESSKPSNYSRKSKNLRVVELENPDRVLPIMDMEWISETAWSDDGNLLIVRGREWYRGGSRRISKVIDLKHWKERKVEGMPLESVSNFQEWNDGFVCSVVKILKENPRVSKWRVGYFALKEDSTFQTAEGEFHRIHFLRFNGSDAVFGGRRFNESEQKTPGFKPAQYFTLSANLRLTELPEFSVAGENPWTEYFSFDGMYRIEQDVVDDQATRSRLPEFSIFRNKALDGRDQKSDAFLWKGEVREFRWHPNSNSAIWKDNDEDVWLFFDPDKMPEPRRVSGVKVATPIENGWLIAKNQEVQQVGFDGKVIAKLSFDEGDSGGPVNPVWVFADGTVIGDRGPLHLIYKTDQEFRIDRLPDFFRKFPNATLPESKPTGLQIQQLQVE